jgi:hypothetical protein
MTTKQLTTEPLTPEPLSAAELAAIAARLHSAGLFAAHARTDVRRLLAEVHRLRHALQLGGSQAPTTHSNTNTAPTTANRTAPAATTI